MGWANTLPGASSDRVSDRSRRRERGRATRGRRTQRTRRHPPSKHPIERTILQTVCQRAAAAALLRRRRGRRAGGAAGACVLAGAGSARKRRSYRCRAIHQYGNHQYRDECSIERRACLHCMQAAVFTGPLTAQNGPCRPLTGGMTLAILATRIRAPPRMIANATFSPHHAPKAGNVGSMSEANGKREGIGSSILRLEDDRYLRGRGRFIADIRLPGMLDVAFVRSPLAHGWVRGITKPKGHEASVFVMADLAGVQGIRADSGLPGFRSSVQPVLAYEKVRHVGEPLAACIADTRARSRGHRRTGRARSRGIACRRRHDARPRSRRAAGARALAGKRLSGNLRRCRFRRRHQGRGGDGQAHLPHRAPEHGADGRPRRRRHLGQSGAADRRLHARPRCRISCAMGSPNVSASTRA